MYSPISWVANTVFMKKKKVKTTKTKQKRKMCSRKKTMKKTTASLMLILILIPTVSSFFPQKNATKVDPKLAQAYLEAMNQSEETVLNPDINGTYEVVDIPTDTSLVVLDEGVEKTVKLIGVESISENTEGYLEMMISDDYVDLEFDKEQSDEERNLLAYAYTKDGMLINEELLLRGQAILKEETENVKHETLLKEAQDEAQKRKTGIWNEDTMTE